MTEKEILENSSRILRRLRLQGDNITQAQVAKAIKLIPSGYNQIEGGKRKLHLFDMIRIADFYGIKLSDLAEMLQQSPAELEKIKRLQTELDAALKQNAWLKTELEKVKQTVL